jgi:hypothetical protein
MMSPNVALPQKEPSSASDIQSALLIRAAVYGTACSLYFAITLICTQWMNEPERRLVESLLKSAEDVSYWLPGFLLLVPIAAHDVSKLASQFTKPVVRLQEEMLLLVEDQSDRPLSLNESEYWGELTIAYNQVRGELLQLRKRLDEIEVGTLPPSLMADDSSMSDREAEVEEFKEEEPFEKTVKLDAPPVQLLSSSPDSASDVLAEEVATA